jgi:hypothetical protein
MHVLNSNFVLIPIDKNCPGRNVVKRSGRICLEKIKSSGHVRRRAHVQVDRDDENIGHSMNVHLVPETFDLYSKIEVLFKELFVVRRFMVDDIKFLLDGLRCCLDELYLSVGRKFCMLFVTVCSSKAVRSTNVAGMVHVERHHRSNHCCSSRHSTGAWLLLLIDCNMTFLPIAEQSVQDNNAATVHKFTKQDIEIHKIADQCNNTKEDTTNTQRSIDVFMDLHSTDATRIMETLTKLHNNVSMLADKQKTTLSAIPEQSQINTPRVQVSQLDSGTPRYQRRSERQAEI